MPPKRKRAKKTHTGDGSTYITRRISRTINNQTYTGTITTFHPRYNLWKVTYDDGDVEDLNHEELLLAMDAFERGDDAATAEGKNKNFDASYVGKRVSRKFGGKVYHGSVDGLDEKDRLWHLTFDDGDEEELDHLELLFALDLYESTQGNVPKKGGTQSKGMAVQEAAPKHDDGDEQTKENGNGPASGSAGIQSSSMRADTKSQEKENIKPSESSAPSQKTEKKDKDLLKQQSYTIPILVVIIAMITWLCKQMLVASVTEQYIEERLLRSTGLLKFQPDKFQGAHKKKRYFEGWYYKLVSPLNNNDSELNEGAVVSMAVVPGIFYGKEQNSNESHAFVFVTINGEKQHYYRYPTSEFSYSSSREEYYIQVADNRFTYSGITLNLVPKDEDDADLVLRGELEFNNPSPWPVSLTHLGAMGPVGWIPFLECTHGILSFDHVLRGSLTMSYVAITADSVDNGEVNGEEEVPSSTQSSAVITFDNGRGYTEKDFGRSFPSLWVWIQSNSFRNNPGTSLFVSIARVPVFGLGLPGFTAAVWHNSTLIPFATWSGATFEDIRISGEEVYIAMRSSSRRHSGSGYRVELTVDRRNVPEVLLYAPVNFTKMAPFVSEALQARVHMRLLDGHGDVIVDDIGKYAGLEVHGDVQWLVDNVCGKETANKFACL